MREKGLIAALPIVDYVAATSVGIIDGVRMLDLAYDEDSRAEVDMNVVMTGSGKFIEVQGTAEALPFGRDALLELLDLAHKGIGEIVELQKKAVSHLLK
jgi:ribonuclease PH